MNSQVTLSLNLRERGGQKNLRGRVSAAAHFNEEDNSTPNEITVYSYDIHGNVKTLLHHHKNSELEINDFKKIDYFYDLISGKVNKVFFEKGNKDQFIHSYTYDKNNRIEAVYTSRNGVVWDKDAAYSYYKHGPLSRLTIGNNRVQAMDYYYTLQGWIKGVNSELINNTADPGVAYNNKFMPQDAFGYSLRYYGGDYTSIGNQQGLSYALANNSAIQGAYNTHAPNLYNGNISAMHSSGMFGNTPSDVKSSVNFYKYDLLNRIRTSVTYTEANYSGNSWLMPSTNLTDYATSYTYDGNGNIKTLNRNASTLNSNPLEMDDLTYHYYPHTNKLEYVSDNTNYTNNYQVDIDNQNELNFTYDSIGNLVSDASEEIETIKWTVFGKIKEIIRTSHSTKPNLVFEYDATGNRISKLVIPKLSSGAVGPLNRWIYTVYYRDAQGNILATYIRKPNMLDIAEYKVEEFSIYGSSRIGVKNADDLDASLFNDVYFAEALGLKTFELSDHLGNVREVISDRKIPGQFIKTYSTQNFESCQTPGDCGIYAEIPSPPGEYPYSGTTLQIVNNQGSKQLRIATDYQWDGAHIPMATEAGQRYLLELDASFNTSNIGVRLSVYPKNPGGSEYLDIAIAPGHNSVEFTANTALTDIKPYRAYNFGTPGAQDEFFIDNIMLKAIYTSSPPSDAQVLNYKPDVAAANEYYPFGMLIESRKHLAFGGDYAYGFNGKMVDKEVKGEGSQQDYGMRIYDTRLGKFLSVDPISKQYPELTPFQFASNTPIRAIDLDGLEAYIDKSGYVIPGSSTLPHKIPKYALPQLEKPTNKTIGDMVETGLINLGNSLPKGDINNVYVWTGSGDGGNTGGSLGGEKGLRKYSKAIDNTGKVLKGGSLATGPLAPLVAGTGEVLGLTSDVIETGLDYKNLDWETATRNAAARAGVYIIGKKIEASSDKLNNNLPTSLGEESKREKIVKFGIDQALDQVKGKLTEEKVDNKK